MPKLRPHVKKLLLEALRSGDYIQTYGNMTSLEPTGRCFCFLGVICDLSGMGSWRPNQDGYYVFNEDSFNGEAWSELVWTNDALESYRRVDPCGEESYNEEPNFDREDILPFLRSCLRENMDLEDLFIGYDEFPPDEVVQMAFVEGTSVDDLHLSWEGDKFDVAELNDSRKLTFEQLADLVEAQW